MTTPDIDDVLALSPLQLGLYSHATLIGPDAEDPYVIAMTADVFGPLDVDLLRDCASAMLVRHPNLRASFWHQDLPRPVQIVPSAVELPWQQVRAEDDQAAALEQHERSRRFTLHDGPLIRFLLIELPDQRWRLVVTAHHIVIDGWSLPVFIGEMLTLYRGGGNPDILPRRGCIATTSAGSPTETPVSANSSGAGTSRGCRDRHCCRRRSGATVSDRPSAPS